MSWLRLGMKLFAAGAILAATAFTTEAAPRTSKEDGAFQLVRIGGGGRGGGYRGGGYRGGGVAIRRGGYGGYNRGYNRAGYGRCTNPRACGRYGSRARPSQLPVYRSGNRYNRPAQLPAYRYGNRNNRNYKYANRYPRYGYRRYGYNHYYNGYWYAYPWWLGAATVGAAVASTTYDDSDGAWCASRYRTYDPATNTYIGKGGRRYQCLGPQG